jgi:hypothetical protein
MKQLKILLIFSFILLGISAWGQEQPDPPAMERSMKNPFADKLVWGGNLGLQFGSQSLVDVSPIIGYKVTDRFVPGFGATYRYISWHAPGNPPVRANFYGGSVWARFYIIPEIFIHAEYESLNGEWEPYLRPGYRYFLNTPFLGGGYSQNMGGVSSYIMLLYIINYSYDSPYASPLVLRVGFTVGI